MYFARFSLAAIRQAATALFAEWDAAVLDGRLDEARHIRIRRLWPLVRAHVSHEALSYPGIYAFIDNTDKRGWQSINYIGQTGASLQGRIDDYVKDDSAWDIHLVSDIERIAEIGLKRLRPVMHSTDETFRGYIQKHAATLRKTRGCSLFVAGFDRTEAELIVQVEAALIAVAWNNGAPLENDKLERLPTRDQRSRVLGVCTTLIAGWKELGLNADLCRVAEEALMRAAVPIG